MNTQDATTEVTGTGAASTDAATGVQPSRDVDGSYAGSFEITSRKTGIGVIDTQELTRKVAGITVKIPEAFRTKLVPTSGEDDCAFTFDELRGNREKAGEIFQDASSDKTEGYALAREGAWQAVEILTRLVPALEQYLASNKPLGAIADFSGEKASITAAFNDGKAHESLSITLHLMSVDSTIKSGTPTEIEGALREGLDAQIDKLKQAATTDILILACYIETGKFARYGEAKLANVLKRAQNGFPSQSGSSSDDAAAVVIGAAALGGVTGE